MKSSFADALRRVWPNHSAKQIALLSGISQRNVESWLSGLSKPSAEAIRALLSSERGYDFLVSLLDGADAEWLRVVRVSVRLADLERRSAETKKSLQQMRHHDEGLDLSLMDDMARLHPAR